MILLALLSCIHPENETNVTFPEPITKFAFISTNQNKAAAGNRDAVDLLFCASKQALNVTAKFVGLTTFRPICLNLTQDKTCWACRNRVGISDEATIIGPSFAVQFNDTEKPTIYLPSQFPNHRIRIVPYTRKEQILFIVSISTLLAHAVFFTYRCYKCCLKDEPFFPCSRSEPAECQHNDDCDDDFVDDDSSRHHKSDKQEFRRPGTHHHHTHTSKQHKHANPKQHVHNTEFKRD
ncbi:hypothetical protein BLNAU_6738 [Blattamonas nauphoetae]|uniref:Uncharacterized protein n=1 Tax=Blattamonas nauphoetae TaxID=2049346 RepID=A0ABQ9Y3E0_9EUKA|nr:hypothetical protein BLNAU_6738 [Blattamonas nauphoetae]